MKINGIYSPKLTESKDKTRGARRFWELFSGGSQVAVAPSSPGIMFKGVAGRRSRPRARELFSKGSQVAGRALLSFFLFTASQNFNQFN